MRQCAPRMVLTGLAACFLMASGANAQPIPTPLPEPPPPEVSGVIVTPPKVVERTRYGLVSREMSLSARVPYGDLDMMTPAGIGELDRRVAEAARYLCQQLDILYPDGAPDEFQCAKRAVADARPQVILARTR